MNLEGVSALVTGGGSGLGEATVRRLAESGAFCTILDSDGANAQKVASSVGNGVQWLEADVTDASGISRAIEMASDKAEFRICVNCAGVAPVGRVLSKNGAVHGLETFERTIAVNLIGTFNVMRLAAQAMAQASPQQDGERGVVINTASVAAFEGQIGQIAYAASKGGIAAMTLPAARDLASAGIRVVTVAPGVMETPLMASLPEKAKASLATSVPFPQRLGSPEDFAALVKHICENRYLNGEIIRLDGALRMGPK